MAKRRTFFTRLRRSFSKRKQDRKDMKLKARLLRKQRKQDRKDKKLELRYGFKDKRLSKRERTQGLRIKHGVDLGSTFQKVAPSVLNSATNIVGSVTGLSTAKALGGAFSKGSSTLTSPVSALKNISSNFLKTNTLPNPNPNPNPNAFVTWMNEHPIQFAASAVGFVLAVVGIIALSTRDKGGKRRGRRY